MRRSLTVLLLVVGLGLGCPGCARFYANVYDGVQMQKRQEGPPDLTDDTPERNPSYDEYLRQRREVTENRTPAPFPEPEKKFP